MIVLYGAACMAVGMVSGGLVVAWAAASGWLDRWRRRQQERRWASTRRCVVWPGETNATEVIRRERAELYRHGRGVQRAVEAHPAGRGAA